MKRDMKIVRLILEAAESYSENIQVPRAFIYDTVIEKLGTENPNNDLILYNIILLIDNGYLYDYDSAYNVTLRLTWDGHDLLDKLRKEDKVS